MESHDVIIVGAGAAGLACADALHDAGVDFVLLDSEPRAGGRVRTFHDEGVALELGAEFVHGGASASRRYAEAFRLPSCEVTDRHWQRHGRGWRELRGFWDALHRELARLPRPHGDVAVTEALAGLARTRRTRHFLAYVEGFHAADPARLSLRALRDAERGGDHGLLRFPLGYAELPGRILPRFHETRWRPRHRLRRVRWDDAGVRVFGEVLPRGEAFELGASCLVLALPPGVLLAPPSATCGLLWLPEPPAGLERALGAIRAGHVQRLVFRFRRRFWGEKARGFLHADPRRLFPVWWSLDPLRTNHLVAWQGGPGAEALRTWAPAERVDAALATLAELTGRRAASLAREVERCFTHDWSNDPAFLGAYSYVTKGGSAAAARLARPFGRVLLAGEVTATGEGRGTVHGALASGWRAAKQALRLLGAEASLPRRAA